LLALCALSLAAARASAADAGDVAKALELHYNRLATLQLDFEQEVSFGGRSRPIERGVLSLRRPGRMRWDYSRPEGKLLVGEGDRLEMFNPLTNQVRVMRLDPTADLRAPLAFLLGRLDFSRQFNNLELETIEGRPALTAEGRSGQETYGRVEFFYDPESYRLEEVRVHGKDQSLTTFRFSGERTNPNLDEAMFSFSAPPGAEVLPETELGADN